MADRSLPETALASKLSKLVVQAEGLFSKLERLCDSLNRVAVALDREHLAAAKKTAPKQFKLVKSHKK